MNFKLALQQLTDRGFNPYPPIPHIQVPHAKEALQDGLQYYLGTDYQWLPAYDKVAEWLTDNHQRGLLCVGDCGLGKTVLCCKVLPVILHHYCHKVLSVYDATTIGDHLQQAKTDPLIVIDDLGTEPVESIHYGERHIAFSEITDEAEKRGHLLILTTNLTTSTPRGKGTDYPSLENRYGIRTLDRLRAITTVVVFKGDSLRK